MPRRACPSRRARPTHRLRCSLTLPRKTATITRGSLTRGSFTIHHLQTRCLMRQAWLAAVGLMAVGLILTDPAAQTATAQTTPIEIILKNGDAEHKNLVVT